MDWFWSIFGVGGSVAGIALIVYLQAKGPGERTEEDDARAFFDEHGHWPDETAEDAAQRMRAADEAARHAAAATRAGRTDVEVDGD